MRHVTGLEIFNLESCRNLISLPSFIGNPKHLRVLNPMGCSKLEKLPEDLGNMENLEDLDISWTAIQQLPPSLMLLKKLERLSFGRRSEPRSNWRSSLI